MSRKKVLIFSLAYYPLVGGAEIAVKEITDRLLDIEFVLITLCFDKKHLEKEKIGNCIVYRINSSKNLYPFKALFLATKLHKLNSFDATWAIMANWAGLAALFFKYKFPSVKYILTLQEGDSLEYIKKKIWFIYPLFKKIFARADKIQAISNFLANWAKDMGYKGRVEVIPNGVNVEQFKNVQSRALDKNNMTLITTSRLVTKNGVADIIGALPLLPDNITLKILGIGPLEKELKRQATNLNLNNRVIFLGNIPNEEIPKYLHEADIFVRPSLSEGMGNSFIEAMASGLPVIATPVGGIPDFLKNEETGLFCEVKNPKSIADQVKRLLDDNELRERLIANSAKMVKEKYDWNLIAREMKVGVFDKV